MKNAKNHDSKVSIDQLAAADSPETTELQHEIEDLETRIDELTSFSSANQVD